MDIQAGEYVRTTDGLIGKFKRIELDEMDKSLKWYVLDKKRYDMNIIDELYINKPYIKKHSSNIIDLIEVGDYVNGYKILDIADSIYKNSKRILIYRNEKEKYEKWIYIQEYDGKIHTQDDIKSIVTKEQFKLVEY